MVAQGWISPCKPREGAYSSLAELRSERLSSCRRRPSQKPHPLSTPAGGLQGTVFTEGSSSSPPPFFAPFLYLFSLNTPSTAAASVSSTSRGRFLLYHSFEPGCSLFPIDNLTLPSKDIRKILPQSQLLHTIPTTPKPSLSPKIYPPYLVRTTLIFIHSSTYSIRRKGRAVEERLYSTVIPSRRVERSLVQTHETADPSSLGITWTFIPQPKVIRRSSTFPKAAAAHLREGDNFSCSTLLIQTPISIRPSCTHQEIIRRVPEFG